MCLLAFKPKGEEFKPEWVKNGVENNNDGMGIAYVKDGKMIVRKGFYKKSKFAKQIELLKDYDVLIHMRAASPQMEVSVDMCHPFYFASEKFSLPGGKPRFHFAVGHNGKLAHRSTKKESDTYCFVHDVLKPILDQNPWAFAVTPFLNIMEKHIMKDNKICILRYDAAENEVEHFILNPDGGYILDKTAHYVGKVWMSNRSYLPAVKYVAPVYTNHGSSNGYVGGIGTLPFDDHDMEEYAAIMNPMSKPDSCGWFWSFVKNCWVNKITGAETNYLKSRPNRPAYMKNDDTPRFFRMGDGTDKSDPKKADEVEIQESKKAKEMQGGAADNTTLIVLEGGAKDSSATGEDWSEDGETDEAISEHLNVLCRFDQFDIKILKREAQDYVKGMEGVGTDLKPDDAIRWMACDVKQLLPQTEGMSIEQVYRWIVKQSISGVSIASLIEASQEPEIVGMHP